LLDSFKESLKVTTSSTNLIKFNVEDILALPQLKQGKFTKSISEDSVWDAVEEVVKILELQSTKKEIDIVEDLL
jgi:hypothetical protein